MLAVHCEPQSSVAIAVVVFHGSIATSEIFCFARTISPRPRRSRERLGGPRHFVPPCLAFGSSAASSLSWRIIRHFLWRCDSHRSTLRFTRFGPTRLARCAWSRSATHRQCNSGRFTRNARGEFFRRSSRPHPSRKAHHETSSESGASILCVIFVLMALATFLLPAHYARQFRDIPNAGPSTAHPLGTDALGRDSLSRLLYGTRVSLLLARPPHSFRLSSPLCWEAPQAFWEAGSNALS